MPRLAFVVLVLALLFPAAAEARPGRLVDDMAVARAQLPAGHPCLAHVDVIWVPGLTLDGAAVAGLAPDSGCWIALNPDDWKTWEPCDRRRIVMHEYGHLRGERDMPGSRTLMDPEVDARAHVSVPGCPGPTLRDRAEERLLSFVPVGWSVVCTTPRRHTVTCRAEGGLRGVRRYRVRGSAVSGALTVRRM